MQNETNTDLKRAVDEHWPLAIVGALTGVLVVILVRHIEHGSAGFFAADQSWGDQATSLPVKALGVPGACLLLLGLMQLALFVWWRRRIDQIPRRAIGFALLLLATSGLLGIVGGEGATWGGAFGNNLARGFQEVLPTPLAVLVTAGLLIFALVMARDWFFYDALRRWLAGNSAGEAFALGMDSQPSALNESKSSNIQTRGSNELSRSASDLLGTNAVVDNRDIAQSESFPDLEPIVANLDDIRAPRPLAQTEHLSIEPDLEEVAGEARAHAPETTSFSISPLEEEVDQDEVLPQASPLTGNEGATPAPEADEELSSFLADESVDFDALEEEIDFSVPLTESEARPETITEVITEEIPIVDIDDVEFESALAQPFATDEVSENESDEASTNRLDFPEVLGFGLEVDPEEARVTTSKDLSEATSALALEATELDDLDEETSSSALAEEDELEPEALSEEWPLEELPEVEAEADEFDDSAETAVDPDTAGVVDLDAAGVVDLTAAGVVDFTAEDVVDVTATDDEDLDADGVADFKTDVVGDSMADAVVADDLQWELATDQDAEESTDDLLSPSPSADLAVETQTEDDGDFEESPELAPEDRLELASDESLDEDNDDGLEADAEVWENVEDVAAAFEAALEESEAEATAEASPAAGSWIEHQTELAEMTGVMTPSQASEATEFSPGSEVEAGEDLASPLELEEAPAEAQNQLPLEETTISADDEDWGSWIDEPSSAPRPSAGPGFVAESNGLDDEVYERAVRACLDRDRCSVSLLQRQLGLGFAEAAAAIERMEAEGVVGPYRGTGDREILVEVTE